LKGQRSEWAEGRGPDKNAIRMIQAEIEKCAGYCKNTSLEQFIKVENNLDITNIRQIF